MLMGERFSLLVRRSEERLDQRHALKWDNIQSVVSQAARRKKKMVLWTSWAAVNWSILDHICCQSVPLLGGGRGEFSAFDIEFHDQNWVTPKSLVLGWNT